MIRESSAIKRDLPTPASPMIDTPWVEPVRSTSSNCARSAASSSIRPMNGAPVASGGSTPTRANGSMGAHTRMGSAFPFTVTGGSAVHRNWVSVAR